MSRSRSGGCRAPVLTALSVGCGAALLIEPRLGVHDQTRADPSVVLIEVAELNGPGFLVIRAARGASRLAAEPLAPRAPGQCAAWTAGPPRDPLPEPPPAW